MITELYAQLRSLLLEVATAYAIAFVVGAVILLLFVSFLAEFLRFRGARLVTCPETHAPALVEIDALHAAVGKIIGERDLRLLSCSRWAASQNCGRKCLKAEYGRV